VTTIAFEATASDVLWRGNQKQQVRNSLQRSGRERRAPTQQANTKGSHEQAMPPTREFRGPWHVVASRERPNNRDRAKVISKTDNDESDGPTGSRKSRTGHRKRLSRRDPLESPKPVRPSNREDRQRQPAGDWYDKRQMDQRTESDYASDTMDHPVHLTVSQDEAKAWRASVKQQQEDKDREKEMEASKYAAPPAHR